MSSDSLFDVVEVGVQSVAEVLQGVQSQAMLQGTMNSKMGPLQKLLDNNIATPANVAALTQNPRPQLLQQFKR